MIEFTKSFKTGDGKVFGTVEEAQVHEIEELLNQVITNSGGNEKWAKMNLNDWANLILGNKGILVDILTTTPSSKPKARAIHGGTKKRGKKTLITDADMSLNAAANGPAESPLNQ